jgi:16S rRNA (cytidine1402-2'-O)-methyltransferase
LAQALSFLDQRPITLARELTKQFEEIATLAAADLPQWLHAQPHRTKGEFVVVLHPIPPVAESGKNDRILALLLAELPLKTAVKLAAEITGEGKNGLYERALVLKVGEK